MMSTLNALKLSTAKKSLNTTPVVHRRNKLGKKLWEQIQLAQAHLAGKQFTATRYQTVRDEDGVRRSVEVPKRIRAWWWNSDNGKIALNVHYGARVVELAKGKSTIEVAAPTDLIPTLELIKKAVEAGELDTQIETASIKLRKGFGK
jgi:hypothetical protein